MAFQRWKQISPLRSLLCFAPQAASVEKTWGFACTILIVMGLACPSFCFGLNKTNPTSNITSTQDNKHPQNEVVRETPNVLPTRISRRLLPNIDLAAMVDVAFLLLMFFMLNGSVLRDPDDLADVPSIQSGFHGGHYPQGMNMYITVVRDGRIFVRFDNPAFYTALISAAERAELPAISPLGTAIERQGRELLLPNTQTQTILQYWLLWAKAHNPHLRVAIIGDSDAPYTAMDKVWTALQDAGILKFRLITQLERDPRLSKR